MRGTLRRQPKVTADQIGGVIYATPGADTSDNFSGDFYYVVHNDSGYTYANAVEFSTMMAERLGWASYGDTQYVSHVLRYYPFGKATGMGNQAIVEVALCSTA